MADQRLLPPPLRDERGRALLALLDRWDTLPLENLLVYRFDGVPASALEALAWQFHVLGDEGWALAESEAGQRELVRRAIELHRRKGTPWAIREALRALGFVETVFDEGVASDPPQAGDWARYRALVYLGPDRGLAVVDRDRVARTIRAWAPARAHLVGLGFGVALEESVDTAEGFRVQARARFSDTVQWGRGVVPRDGSVSYAHGIARRHDGAVARDGSSRHRSWIEQGTAHSGERDRVRTAARVRPADRVQFTVYRDGSHAYAGALVHGANAAAVDGATLEARYRVHRNGTWTRNGARRDWDRFNGQAPRNGTRRRKAPARFAGYSANRLEI